jgi:hypothetical protein
MTCYVRDVASLSPAPGLWINREIMYCIEQKTVGREDEPIQPDCEARLNLQCGHNPLCVLEEGLSAQGHPGSRPAATQKRWQSPEPFTLPAKLVKIIAVRCGKLQVSANNVRPGHPRFANDLRTICTWIMRAARRGSKSEYPKATHCNFLHLDNPSVLG